MSKKIIAILTIATILFVCLFAACEKDEGVYTGTKDFDLVTDENGEKVLAEDGQLLVYATDENGKYVTNESGEKVTERKTFQPIEEDGVIEDYGFKIELPEGWKTTEKFGVFLNEEKQQEANISILEYLYDDYYEKVYAFYTATLNQGFESTWEEKVDLGKDFEKVIRYTCVAEGNIVIVYVFENSNNLYKVVFTSPNNKTVLKDSETFCKNMDFKSFTYYNDITAVSKEETTK